MLAVIPPVVLAFTAWTAAAETTITGDVTHVRDGDTIEIGAVAIRLNGVSAPERDERYGSDATAFMRDLVLGKEISCVLNGERSYDRYIGTCFFEGSDIGAAIIQAGWARDCPRYSKGRYAEAEARAARTGIHAGYALPRYCRPRN